MDKIETSNRLRSKLLTKVINSAHLSVFFRQQELFSYENKSLNDKLDYLFKSMNETNNLNEQFENFLCEEVKYTVNRIVVTTPIKITDKSPLFDTYTFNDAFPDYAEYNNISILDDDELDAYFREDPLKYIQILEEKKEEDGQITLISKAFVKKKKQVRTITIDEEPETTITPLLDFVWIDIFPQKNYYRMHFSEGIPSTEGQLTFEQIYEHFSKEIENQYKTDAAVHSADMYFIKYIET